MLIEQITCTQDQQLAAARAAKRARERQRALDRSRRNTNAERYGPSIASTYITVGEPTTVDDARLFYAGVVAFIFGMILQLAGAWPGCCRAIGIIPQSVG